MILLYFGWMVDQAMSIFEFLTKFLVFWHPWHPWVSIRSDLKPLFETDMSDSSYYEFEIWLNKYKMTTTTITWIMKLPCYLGVVQP